MEKNRFKKQISKSSLSPIKLITKATSKISFEELEIEEKVEDRVFAQSREEMIEYYLNLADEYRNLLKEREEIEEERKKVVTSIASIYLQDEKLDFLIKKVESEKGLQSS